MYALYIVGLNVNSEDAARVGTTIGSIMSQLKGLQEEYGGRWIIQSNDSWKRMGKGTIAIHLRII